MIYVKYKEYLISTYNPTYLVIPPTNSLKHRRESGNKQKLSKHHKIHVLEFIHETHCFDSKHSSNTTCYCPA